MCDLGSLLLLLYVSQEQTLVPNPQWKVLVWLDGWSVGGSGSKPHGQDMLQRVTMHVVCREASNLLVGGRMTKSEEFAKGPH